jgi:RNA polymerase sigma-70 factor (ECF subfamily)
MNEIKLKYKEQISLPNLYEKYSNDIYKYSFSLLKSSDEAQDAVQETFIKCAQNSESFNQGCSIKTWLLVIARNYCFNRLKSKNFNTGHIDEEQYYGSYSSSYDLKISIEEALNKLAPEYNELFYLKEYEGYSYKEISEITGLSLENVKIKLFRARQILRKLLSE